MSIRTLTSTVVFENSLLSVREDEVELADGAHARYTVVDRDDFALVVPEERGGFHLVEQYRHATQRRSWEFPSGSLPAGVTGTAEETAATELAEETGLTAGTWQELGYLHVANGTTGEGVHIFHATDLTPGPPDREVSEQDMRQHWFPRAEVEQMIGDGVITDAPSVAAYLLWSLRRVRPTQSSRRSEQ